MIKKPPPTANRAPLGTPDILHPQNRDLYLNTQPRIQILPRSTEISKFEIAQHIPLISSQSSPSTTAVAELPPTVPVVPNLQPNEMAAEGDLHGTFSRLHPSPDGSIFPLLRSARQTRLLEVQESPRSSAPVSLEDYVKHRPTIRKDRRGSKLNGPCNYEETSCVEAPQCKSTNDIARSNLQKILDEGFENSKDHADVLKEKLLVDFQNFAETGLDGLFDDPSDVNEGNGNLRRANHTNGDMSIFQWSLAEHYWIYLGRVPQSRVERFTRFLQNIYGDSQHFNMRGHRLARARIAAMVKQFCDPSTSMVMDGQATSPVSQRIYQYHCGIGIETINSKTSILDLQPLSTNVKDSHQIQLEDFTTTDHCQTQALTQVPFSAFESSGISPESARMGDLSEETRQQYRERERLRLLQGIKARSSGLTFQERLEQLQHEHTTMMQSLKFNRGDCLDPMALNKLPNRSILSSIDRNIGSHDLRRSIFRDTRRSNSATMQKLAKDFQLLPQSKVNQMSLSGESNRLFATISQIFNNDIERIAESELQMLERPSLKTPFQPARRSILTDEELRRSVPLIPQDPRGPFLTGKGVDPTTGFGNGESFHYPSQEEYIEELEKFWNSGKQSRQRQQEFVARTLAAKGDTEANNPEAAATMYIMVAMHERLQEYTLRDRLAIGMQPRATDYFAKFVEPPEWCIDKSLVGMNGKKWMDVDSGGSSGGNGRSASNVVSDHSLGFERVKAMVSDSVRVEVKEYGTGITGAQGRVQSLLGETEWMGAPERVGRDPRYRPLIAGGLTFGGIGSGRMFR